MALHLAQAQRFIDAQLNAAACGDGDACFDLGMAYSTGSEGCSVDLIEAHKWFNLAALAGVREGALLRTEVAQDMSAADVAAAQRAARDFLRGPGTAAPQMRAA